MDMKSAVKQAGPKGIVQLGPNQYLVSSDMRALIPITETPDFKSKCLYYEEATCDNWEVVPPPHGLKVGDTVEADDLRFEIVYMDRLDLCALTIKCTGGSRCGSLGKSRHVSQLKFISRPDKPQVYVFEKVTIKQMKVGHEHYVYLPVNEDYEDNMLRDVGLECGITSTYRLTLEKMTHDESEEE